MWWNSATDSALPGKAFILLPVCFLQQHTWINREVQQSKSSTDCWYSLSVALQCARWHSRISVLGLLLLLLHHILRSSSPFINIYKIQPLHNHKTNQSKAKKNKTKTTIKHLWLNYLSLKDNNQPGKCSFCWQVVHIHKIDYMLAWR